jgi:hypothetical protein
VRYRPKRERSQTDVLASNNDEAKVVKVVSSEYVPSSVVADCVAWKIGSAVDALCTVDNGSKRW